MRRNVLTRIDPEGQPQQYIGSCDAIGDSTGEDIGSSLIHAPDSGLSASQFQTLSVVALCLEGNTQTAITHICDSEDAYSRCLSYHFYCDQGSVSGQDWASPTLNIKALAQIVVFFYSDIS